MTVQVYPLEVIMHNVERDLRIPTDGSFHQIRPGSMHLVPWNSVTLSFRTFTVLKVTFSSFGQVYHLPPPFSLSFSHRDHSPGLLLWTHLHQLNNWFVYTWPLAEGDLHCRDEHPQGKGAALQVPQADSAFGVEMVTEPAVWGWAKMPGGRGWEELISP